MTNSPDSGRREDTIRLATDPGDLATIARQRGELVARLGLPPAAASLGRVFEDEYVEVYRDPVVFPSGALGTYLRVAEHGGPNGGAVVLPVVDGRLLLRRVFRYATGAWELEAPRGFAEAGEAAETTARRELAEEMGLDVRELVPIGTVAPNSGLLASVVGAFVAEAVPALAAPRPEPTEALGAVRALDQRQVRDLVASGGIRDGFTLAALALAWAGGALPTARA